MERRVKNNCNPTGELLTSEDAKNQWAAMRLLAFPEDVLNACPQQSDYWDVIFHAVPEWLDMVKYNFIMSIIVLNYTWELKCF